MGAVDEMEYEAWKTAHFNMARKPCRPRDRRATTVSTTCQVRRRRGSGKIWHNLVRDGVPPAARGLQRLGARVLVVRARYGMPQRECGTAGTEAQFRAREAPRRPPQARKQAVAVPRS